MTPVIQSSLRQYRVRLGWSQAELADRVGASRQAIIAIESNRQVPSTELSLRLAGALRCLVEDLFQLSEEALVVDRSEEHDVPMGRVRLGRVDQRWVAHPASEQSCDGIARTQDRAAQVTPLLPLSVLEQTALVAGCAPLLGILGQRMAERGLSTRTSWLSATSTRALQMLRDDQVHVAGIHLVDTDVPRGHVPLVQQMFSGRKMTVINLTRFRQGLFLRPDNPKSISSVADFFREDVRVALRPNGSGAQILTEKKLREEASCGLTLDSPVARTHEELASWVSAGLVDVGVGMEPVALRTGLTFVPIAEERFDLVLPEHRLKEPAVAGFLDQIEADGFLAEVAHLPGYDMGIAGHATSVPV